MRRLLTLLVMMPSIAFAGECHLVMDEGWPSMKDCPEDVTDVVDRSANCQHFAGEFNGDGSEHDQEINRKVGELKCNSLTKETQEIKTKYTSDPVVRGAFMKVVNDVIPNL